MDSQDPRESVLNEQDSTIGTGTPPISDAANPAAPLISEPEETESDTIDAIINYRTSDEADSTGDEGTSEDRVHSDDADTLSSDEAQENTPEPSFDYSTLSKSDLIKVLSNLIEVNPPEKIRRDVDAIKICFYKKHKADIEKLHKQFLDDGGDPEAFQPTEDSDESLLKELLKKYRHQRSELAEKLEADKEKNLIGKHQIIEELKLLTASSEFANETFQAFRELQTKWRSIGPVPQAQLKDLWETYHHHVEIFYNYIKINKELRDLDLKKNLEQKMLLCEKAEELLMEPSVIKAFKSLQKLHEAWREIGPVIPEMKNEIWERFKDVTAKLNKKHQEYFENQKEEQRKNLEQKVALCERAEEIATRKLDSASDWDKGSLEMIEIQKIWKTIGFAPKKENTKIYTRFRNICDQFFLRKRDHFSQSREEQSNNLQIKEDLCNQAEALKESTKWKETTEDLIELQKRWKEVGPVPRKQSDAIWKRFRSACDYFFERKSTHFSSVDNEYGNNLALKNQLIAEIDAFEPTDSAEENFTRLKDFQRRWSKIGFVPIKHKEEVQKRYREVISKKFDALQLDDTRKNLKHYKNKLDQVSGSPKGDRKLRMEREKLFSRIKQLESEIIVLENNIGFFSKSKNAESMIAEVRKRIERTREEITTTEEKIRLIDQVDE